MKKIYLIMAWLLLTQAVTHATIRYVKPSGTGNGSSWANASGDLQVMINASAVGDQIWVASGTYVPDQIIGTLPSNVRNKTFHLNQDIKLYGGFAGNETTISQRVAGSTSTLSGDLGTVGDNSDNCFHVMVTADLTAATIIDGFTFTKGNANPSSYSFVRTWNNRQYNLAFGGALFNNYSSPTISNCSFTNNYAHFGASVMNFYSSPAISNCNFSNDTARSGCGIYNQYTSSTISNCSFSGNLATNYGGGIMNYYSTTDISQCTFSDNSAPRGAGIYNYYCSLSTISNCTFSDNSATDYGGGIMNDNSTPQISNSTFLGNSASTGGGVYNTNSTPYFSDCTFSGNTATNGGGGMCNNLSAPSINFCIFSGNSAPGSVGAGIANVKCSSSTIISSCSFTSNSGGSGSGIFNDSSAIIINRCSFSGNSATNSGAGLYNKNLALNIYACSFWNNSAANYGGGMFNYNDSSSISNCSFSGNSATNYGGGLFNYNSSSNIGNCSFSGNSAALGCGMFNENTATIYPTIKNCIIWGNGSSNFHDNNYISTVTYSDIQGSSIVNGTGNINSDPLFVNAANPNGPDGIPRTPDDGLALWAGSPAYHTGTATGTPTTDILGTIRNNPPSMGAYENVHYSKLYVNLAAIGSNNGSSWTNAYTNLQTALNTVNIVDTIWVAAGTYIPTTTLSLKNGLAVIGGFAGTETQLSQRNIAANPVIISGNNTRQVFNNANLNSTAVLDGCIISNGNSTTNGAGMYNSYSSPTIRNCIFKDNICNSTANEGGGGMFNYYSNPAMTNCVFANNIVNNSLSGGGMSNDNSNPTINNCLFVGNIVNDYGSGGGMYNFFSNPVINNSVFTSNSVPVNEGGGIYNWSSAPVITNTIIYGNTAAAHPNINSGATINYSDIEGGYSGTGNTNADPLFVNAASPAGTDAQWMTSDDGLTLMPCSPAINAGTTTTPALPVDVLGNARLGTYDMGAYEYQSPQSSYGTVVYVDSTNGNDANSGTSWGNAFKTLSYALYRVQNLGCYGNVDSILVARGTYYPTGVQSGTNRDTTFLIKSGGLKIYGGYPTGGGIRNIAANPTVLSGNINAANSNTDNSYHVMVIAGLAATADSVVVNGVTITAGNANGSGNFTYGTTVAVQINGAGVHAAANNGNTRIAFRNCTFSGNAASGSGGAIYNLTSAPTIANCAFSGNTAINGGAVVNSSSSSTLINCIFSGNTASGSGGAMNTFGSAPTIRNCTISGNTAPNGGAMANVNSTPTISNTIVYGNSSGIYNSSSTPVITYSLVQGITASTGNNINGSTDPLFVNPQPASAAPTIAGNYRLQPCSPAINVGSNSAILSGITTDLSGNPRIFGTTVDMGAYEYIPDVNTGGLPAVNSIVTNIQSATGATIYADNCNNMLGTITGNNAANSISGSTTVKVWIDGTQNPQFVKRHYEITPASNAATATGTVTLYFTQAEFNTFNNANPNMQLPQNLLIEKRSGTSSDGSGNFNTYPGTPTNIIPSSVVWNATASRWEVSFSTTGFSGFWVKTQSVPLPVTLTSFEGTAQNCAATLSWKTATEKNFSHFDIERSSDGIVYQAIGKQSAKGSNSSYSFTDNTLAEGQVMYRLKIVDYDGAAAYSSIVKLNADCHKRALTVSPNPATDQIVVNGMKEGDRLSIYDAQGRLVIAESVKHTNQVMSIGNLAAGFYLIKVTDTQNRPVANIKLLKE